MALLLVCAYCLSLDAERFWLLDILRHFILQYWIGAALLILAFAFYRNIVMAVMMAIILAATTFEIASLQRVSPPTTTSPAHTFTVAQYNRHFNLTEHDEMIAWLREGRPDIAIIQEAWLSHAKAAQDIEDIYPYQIIEPRPNAFGMLLLSRYPLDAQTAMQTGNYGLENFYIRADITIENTPITVYALHPPPPATALMSKQRNSDLDAVISDINHNAPNETIIFVGDFNMTPYSPYFKKMLRETGLKNEYTSLLPVPTWPSVYWDYIFQVPIDHIVHKGNIALIEKTRDDAMESDHYPLIARFAIQ